ncbi:hypothetical protein CEXT_68521 [Caerostris extrusa]|uniref:Uncharacterized protein n=1 Tax=Caerostris extrusa TaxID=172846 RepID=A0AAV4QHY5_CAEEX|nr:hypothetical protein CEXT_68521 [Caerostris extrusa]
MENSTCINCGIEGHPTACFDWLEFPKIFRRSRQVITNTIEKSFSSKIVTPYASFASVTRGKTPSATPQLISSSDGLSPELPRKAMLLLKEIISIKLSGIMHTTNFKDAIVILTSFI